MKDRVPTSPLLYVLLGLVTLNLALTGSLFLSESNSVGAVSGSPDGLPAHISADQLGLLGDRVQALYNQQDAEVMYGAFDELAKVQLSVADLEREVIRLVDMFGSIESNAYSSHESTVMGDFPAYVLKYRISLLGGLFSTGTLTVTVVDREDHLGLIGFKLNAGTN